MSCPVFPASQRALLSRTSFSIDFEKYISSEYINIINVNAASLSSNVSLLNCLNEMRNNLIANGKYTDAVDEVLLKIIDAKQKKFKIIYKEA